MMKKYHLGAGLLGTLFFWGTLGMAVPPMPENLALPGEEHQWLAPFSGEWRVGIKLWMAPGAEPVPYQTVSKHKMILGGRYLQLESSGKMGTIEIGSLMLIGFDRRLKEFTMAGFDTMGTYGISATGSFSKHQEEIILKGENVDPTTKKATPFRFVLNKTEPNTFTLSLFFGSGESLFQVAEMIYTRIEK